MYLSDLRAGETLDEWQNMYAANVSSRVESAGSLRVRSRYQHEVIMPLKEYTSLKEVSVIRPANGWDTLHFALIPAFLQERTTFLAIFNSLKIAAISRVTKSSYFFIISTFICVLAYLMFIS